MTIVPLLLADVAELADAQASGACDPWVVEVRLLSSALSKCQKLSVILEKEVPMGRRRDKLNKRREKQLKTRAANARRKENERARKAKAAAEKAA